jgi:hypothetical protein
MYKPPKNPTPRLYLRFTWIRTLGHVEGGNRCGGYTLLRVTATHWLMGLWSTQARVEGIVLKVTWQWGSDSSVVNDPLAESGRTPLAFRPRGAPWTVTVCFPPISWRDSLTGVSERYKWMNKPLALETEHLFHKGPVGGTWRGAPLLGNLKERCDYVFIRGCVRRRIWRRSISL